jgi:DNA-binding transcriptional LysR family regulator
VREDNRHVIVARDWLCLISPDTASLTPQPEDFAEMSLITFSQGSVYRELLEAWFRNAGVIPRRKFEMSSYHGIISCVAAGTGVSVVPRSTLESLASPAPLGVSPFPFRPTLTSSPP